MNICVLDGYTLNPGDLDWGPILQLGKTTLYDRTPPEKVLERAQGASILLVNKVLLDAGTLQELPDLKCICVLATGFDNIDIRAAAQRHIPVCNVVGYSTESVAQHVFALTLELVNQVGRHHQSVTKGDWQTGSDFSYFLQPIPELSGKVMGIYGFGRIGQRVADIAQAFGMQVLAHHKHPERDARPGVRFVSLPELFAQSDVVSLHAPLSDANKGIVNKDLLARMKPSAILINTGRGGLIQEADLAEALEKGRPAGAGLDVLSSEPPPQGHPLIGHPRCIITPHLAWAGLEARQRLLQETALNIEAFLKGTPRNVVHF